MLMQLSVKQLGNSIEVARIAQKAKNSDDYAFGYELNITKSREFYFFRACFNNDTVQGERWQISVFNELKLNRCDFGPIQFGVIAKINSKVFQNFLKLVENCRTRIV